MKSLQFTYGRLRIILLALLCLSCSDQGAQSGGVNGARDTSVRVRPVPDSGQTDVLNIPFLDAAPVEQDSDGLPVADGGHSPPNDGASSTACSPGTVRCGASGEIERCDDFNNNGMPEWQAVSLCAVGERCQDGQCIEGSSNPCDDRCDAGETRCVGDFYQECENTPEGCWGWSEALSCPQGARCQEGSCVPDAGCNHQCVNDQTICDGDQLRRCVRGDEGCFIWSEPEACPADLRCRLNECRCEDACLVGLSECLDDNIRRCIRMDGCGQWGEPEPCPNDQECRNGFCVNPPCNHECIAPGQQQCDGDQVQVCENTPNGCRVWGAARPCDDGRVCRNNGCVFECENECDFVGAARCADMNQIEECRRDPRTQCLSWENFSMCPPNSVCVDNGQCRMGQ